MREQPTAPPPHRTKAGPRRSEAARVAVLRAADDLLVDVGFQAMTVSGIAERAEVAKQTIYRWWRSKVDILLDVLAEDLRDGTSWPDSDVDAPTVLERHLVHLNSLFPHSSTGQVLFALIGHAQQDAGTAAALHRKVLDHQRAHDVAQLRAVLAGSTAPGRARERPEAGQILDLTVGPIFHRAFMTGTSFDPAFLTRLSAAALSSDTARPAVPETS